VPGAIRDEDRQRIQQKLAGASNNEFLAVLAEEASVLGLTGECREAEPFTSLQLVLDGQGLRWCCTHSPTHCSATFERASLR
jgi:hypothetical protein